MISTLIKPTIAKAENTPIEWEWESSKGERKGESMIVAKQTRIDAAHYLPGYKGKCAHMHGHQWIIEIGIKGNLQPDGMVIDFALIKKFLDTVKDKLDHTLLNDTLENPTAENLAIYVARRWKEHSSFLSNLTLHHVTVWETPDSYARWEA